MHDIFNAFLTSSVENTEISLFNPVVLSVKKPILIYRSIKNKDQN